jgi:hypothetical protein
MFEIPKGRRSHGEVSVAALDESVRGTTRRSDGRQSVPFRAWVALTP